MLKNAVYCGDLISGKRVVNLHKYKKIPEEDWTVQKDHHEPIVSRELFNEVQEILKKEEPIVGDLCQGKLFCAACGAPMAWREGRNHKYGYYLCTNHTGSWPKAERLMKPPKIEGATIKAGLVRAAKRFVQRIQDKAEKVRRRIAIDVIKEQARAALVEKQTVEAKGAKMLDDYREGIIDTPTFMALRVSYRKEIEEKEKVLADILSHLRQMTVMLEKLQDILDEVKGSQEMTAKTAISLTERIEVSKDGKASYTFRGKKELEEMLRVLEKGLDTDD